ncbi:MAG: hypothetical protein LBH85_10005 [Treponema sp.]|jgi:hypothetical protein|nr:hypothetical protein [Treponema sp.]
MHVKTSGGIAGGAFFLSFLVGLIGGAGFPALLVRALAFALFSFVLSEVIHLVVRRFLINSPATVDKEAQPASSHVNISVEDDPEAEAAETAAIADQASSGGAKFVETAAKATAAAAPGADDVATGGVLSDEGSLLGALPASGVLDVEAKSVLAETAGGGGENDGGGADGVKDAESAPPPAFDTTDMLFPNTAMPLKDVKLPDIEHMSGAFVEKKEEELFEPPPRKHVKEASEVLGKNYDPTKVANAIKTLLQQK